MIVLEIDTMPRGQNRNLGKAELTVVEYLSTNPSKNIQEIQKLTNTPNYATINNAVHNLVEKELVCESSKYTSDKGNEVVKWKLSDPGLGYFIIDSKYDPLKVRAMIFTYKDISKQAAALYTMIKATEEVLGIEKAANTLNDFYNLFVIPALEKRIHPGVLMEGANGFLKRRMTPIGFKQWSKLMEEGTWKGCKGVKVCWPPNPVGHSV